MKCTKVHIIFWVGVFCWSLQQGGCQDHVREEEHQDTAQPNVVSDSVLATDQDTHQPIDTFDEDISDVEDTFCENFSVLEVDPKPYGMIALDQEIRIQFSCRLDAQNDLSSFVVIQSEWTGQFPFTYEIQGDVLNLKLERSPLLGEKISVNLTHKILSVEGNILRPFQWKIISSTQNLVNCSSDMMAWKMGVNLNQDYYPKFLTGDFNADGFIDVGFIFYKQFYLLLNQGNGSFIKTDQLMEGSNSSTHDYMECSSGDLDGDGDLDVWLTRLDRQESSEVWFNDGLGYFQKGILEESSALSDGVTLEDINGDGALDALIRVALDDRYIWLNDAYGHMTKQDSRANHTALDFGDLNGDGLLDALVKFNSDILSFGILGMGIRRENWFDQSPSLPLCDMNAMFGKLGDLNNDGRLDAILFRWIDALALEDQVWKVWLNNDTDECTWIGYKDIQNVETAIWWDGTVPIPIVIAYDVELADIDNDGDLDAVVAGSFSWEGARILLNDGNGHFSTGRLRPAQGPSGTQVNLADLDGDQDLDLILSGQVWLNLACDPRPPCAQNSDCDSKICQEGFCNWSSCTDDTLNATETDIDCGGNLCFPCLIGQFCTQNSDCITNRCDATQCQPY